MGEIEEKTEGVHGDSPFGELTPKQEENWESHGRPVYDKIPEAVNRVDNGVTVEEAREWYTDLRRPKMRGDGMMYRDEVNMDNGDLHYLKKEFEDWFSPMSSVHGVIMGRMVAEDPDRMENVAEVLAIARLLAMPESKRRRVIEDHKHRGELYGVA